MNLAEQSIIFSGETFVLSNQRALYWPSQQTLILSDLHLGKAAHFRKNGIALPAQVTVQDLSRLESLINHYLPLQVIIAGDLIHAGANGELSYWEALVRKHSAAVRFILVRGNHDRLPTESLKKTGIHAVHDHLKIGQIGFSHELHDNLENPVVTGHFHPGVRLKLPTKKWLSLPCFAITERQIILPAFSLFTGLDIASVPEKAICYAVYEDGIFKV